MITPHGERPLGQIDVNSVRVAADVDRVWDALISGIPTGLALPRRYLRLIGAHPSRATGVFPAVGATIPGFAVRGVVPGKQLVLAGHHRFSRYALVFTIEPAATGATLSAQTTAEFPGVLGWAYRLLVIHSGAHRIVTRRFLRGIAAHA